MRYTQKPPAGKRRFYPSPHVLCILGFVFTYLVSVAVFTPQASAAALSAPGGNVSDPVVRQVDIARPAVVRILTTLGGQLTVHFTSTAVATFPENGGSYPLEFSGSGAFISAHGDILTADHVVNPPHDQDLDNALYSYAAQDVADYINSHFQVSVPYSANDAYNALSSGQLQSATSYGQPSSVVYLSTSYVGSINATKLDDVPAADHATVDRIEAQSAFSLDDVAIIHVSGMDNMPSIQLGDSSQVAEQDNLTIIGYPGLADLSNSPTDMLTSSINKIYVSALKVTDGGAPVIQVGGNVEHGDSGGPALNDQGSIVGIVSFSYSGTNGDYGETSFLQASNSAESLIKAQGTDTTPGALETAWTQAIDDYSSTSAGHWHKAAQELQSIARTYPNFQGITPYLTYAQSQASHEPSSSSTSSGGLGSVWWIVLLILLLLFALGAGFYIILRRNAQSTVVVAPVPASYPPMAYRAYQQPSPGIYQQPASLPASYGMSAGDAQAATFAASGLQQATPVGANYAQYAASATYGTPVGQIPQTPQPVMGAVSLPLSMQNGRFASPQPIQDQITQAEPGAGTPSEAASQSAIYALPTRQAATLDGSPAQAPLPSDDPWSALMLQRDATADEGKKAALASPSARTFLVPRRPSAVEAAAQEAAEVSASANASSQFTWVAPCGHTNTPEVSFCRICGQRVAAPTSQASTGSVL